MLSAFVYLLAAAAAADGLPDLVDIARQSTVRVDVELSAPVEKSVRVVVGSGVLVRPGIVATCAHLFDEPPSTIKRIIVVPDSGSPEQTATLEVATDSSLDLAYLRVPALQAAPARLAESAPRIGEEVFYVGHPFRLDAAVLGVGTVASDELSSADDRYSRKLRLLDGSVNKGNSGGGVFRRSDGALVGLIQIKAGAIGKEVRALMKAQPRAGVFLDGIDSFKALQATIREMDGQLNLGVSGFVSTSRVLENLPKEP